MRLRALTDRWGVDALVVVLALAAQIEVLVDPTETAHPLAEVAALFWTLPLLLRRRFPLGAPAIVFATLAAEAFLPGSGVIQVDVLALLTAFWVAGAHPSLRSALAGAAIGYAATASVVANDFRDLAGGVLMYVVASATWAVGRALSERARQTAELELRADRLEREQESAVAAERARIARELHDVVAHTVSVMTVQAGAARLLLDKDPTRAREPLLSVEATGRQALADMRRLLGILRNDDERARLAPQPGMTDLAALVEQMRSAGLSTELNVEGDPKPLPPGIDLTAYRIVQEALTNALKHARPDHAKVNVRYGPEVLELEVRNDGQVVADGREGHGIVGMRERVTLYGGTFHAGPADGGYRVHAALPLHPGEP